MDAFTRPLAHTTRHAWHAPAATALLACIAFNASSAWAQPVDWQHPQDPEFDDAGNTSETSGFLTQYCGWHTYGSIGSTQIKYGFIGNPNKNLHACAAQPLRSPNGNPAVDGMISAIAHEAVETVTDPLLNAWRNSAGSESADMCAWTFGSRVFRDGHGAYWNVQLPTVTGFNRHYLLQRQLSVNDSKCYINANGAVQ